MLRTDGTVWSKKTSRRLTPTLIYMAGGRVEAYYNFSMVKIEDGKKFSSIKQRSLASLMDEVYPGVDYNFSEDHISALREAAKTRLGIKDAKVEMTQFKPNRCHDCGRETKYFRCDICHGKHIGKWEADGNKYEGNEIRT
jgi:hypothetical protein